MRNRFIVEERGEISLSADSETAVTCPALSQLLRSLARPTVDRITCHQLKIIDMLQIKYSSLLHRARVNGMEFYTHTNCYVTEDSFDNCGRPWHDDMLSLSLPPYYHYFNISMLNIVLLLFPWTIELQILYNVSQLFGWPKFRIFSFCNKVHFPRHSFIKKWFKFS